MWAKEATMEISGRDSCLHLGRVYSDGSEVCSEEYCIICRRGDWQEKDKSVWESLKSSNL